MNKSYRFKKNVLVVLSMSFCEYIVELIEEKCLIGILEVINELKMCFFFNFYNVFICCYLKLVDVVIC